MALFQFSSFVVSNGHPSFLVGDEDLDLVLDAATISLLDCDELPGRAVEVMLDVLASKEDDLTLIKEEGGMRRWFTWRAV
ncbi:MAG TPA: hypothetical protein VMM76_12190 [Pirellulaceae bacterium]|nr:hypothetical protein [Pirellulaceae bacterium]